MSIPEKHIITINALTNYPMQYQAVCSCDDWQSNAVYSMSDLETQVREHRPSPTLDATPGRKIAHTWCAEKSGEPVVKLDGSANGTLVDQAEDWLDRLFAPVQPHWPCSFCGGPISDAPDDRDFDPNFADGFKR